MSVWGRRPPDDVPATDEEWARRQQSRPHKAERIGGRDLPPDATRAGHEGRPGARIRDV